jgi:hypothetical protein
MSAIPINLKVEKGTDFSKVFTLKDEYGNPVNLTSHSVSAFYSYSYVSSTKYNFTSSIIDPENGQIEISLTAKQTSLLKLPRYVYDIIITSPLEFGGIKSRIYQGVMVISPGVTYYNKTPLSLEQLDNVDTSNIQNNYVLMFDSETQTFKFVSPAEVLDKADGVDDGSLNYGTY